jgi:hypothetical protein
MKHKPVNHSHCSHDPILGRDRFPIFPTQATAGYVHHPVSYQMGIRSSFSGVVKINQAALLSSVTIWQECLGEYPNMESWCDARLASQIFTLVYTCHCTKLITTYSMVHSPSWEANQFSASQEVPHILRNLKVHYRIYKWTPPVPILSNHYKLNKSVQAVLSRVLLCCKHIFGRPTTIHYTKNPNLISFPRQKFTCTCS